MQDIWRIQEPAKFVAEMSEAVQKKCGYGERENVLSDAERVFYLTQLFEMEVNSGGFDSFFYNGYGNRAKETVAALRTIGAGFAADLLEKAMAVFGDEYPDDQDDRVDFIDEHDDGDDGVLDCWEAYEDEFQAAYHTQKPNLNDLNHAYVMRHRADFQ